MGKMLLQTFVGIILLLGSIYSLYLFITSLNAQANFVLLTLFFLLIGGGVFLLIRASKTERTDIAKSPSVRPETADSANAKGLLAKNNELLNEWKKTNDTKERLRMIEMSAAAEATDK